MKKVFFILLLCFCTLMSCDKSKTCVTVPSNEESICVDSLCINDSTDCPLVYYPVCGCNGITYSNSCFASISGVTCYVEGECCD